MRGGVLLDSGYKNRGKHIAVTAAAQSHVKICFRILLQCFRGCQYVYHKHVELVTNQVMPSSNERVSEIPKRRSMQGLRGAVSCVPTSGTKQSGVAQACIRPQQRSFGESSKVSVMPSGNTNETIITRSRPACT